jgi:endonuclease/exonuclease/phosphatase family metal-dependent hydrolase
MRKILLVLTVLAASLFLSSAAAEAKSDNASVMSFNIRVQFPSDTGKYNWESRKNACVKAIKKNFPDILGLQEASADQKSFLVNNLSRYSMVDGSAKPGDINGVTETGYNPILFRADKFELLDYGSFWLNEDQTSSKKGWDADYARNTNWVKLRFIKSDRIIFVFNTQFDHAGAVARRESASLMVDKIKEIAGDDAVVFVTGDFGTDGGDKGLRSLTDYLKQSYRTVKKADKTASFNDFGRKGGKSVTTDLILYRNSEAGSYYVIDSRKFGVDYISDHYPVMSEFSIGKKEK